MADLVKRFERQPLTKQAEAANLMPCPEGSPREPNHKFLGAVFEDQKDRCVWCDRLASSIVKKASGLR